MALLKFPRLKIVSDGLKTRLYDAEGNEVLKGAVRSVRWEHGPGAAARCVIELLPVGVEVEGEVRELAADGEFGEHRRAMQEHTSVLVENSDLLRTGEIPA